MSERNIVDSSAWLECIADSDRAALFAPIIEPERRVSARVSGDNARAEQGREVLMTSLD